MRHSQSEIEKNPEQEFIISVKIYKFVIEQTCTAYLYIGIYFLLKMLGSKLELISHYTKIYV